MAGGAGPHHQFQKPCRWVPRDGNFNPLCRPSLDLSRLCNLDLPSWRFPVGEGEAGAAAAQGAAAAEGAAFVKQLGLSQSHASIAPKVNFGVDGVTKAVEDNAGAGDAGASTFCTGEGILQLSLVVSRSMSSLEELLLELIHDWKLQGMTTATSKSKQ